MLYEQCCILCLEEFSMVDEDGIRIDSNEQQTEITLQMIEQHFKEELIMLEHISSKIVCKQCWNLVQSFHEFYIKVKNAHLAGINKVKSLQEMEITVTEIKIELDTTDHLASAPASMNSEDNPCDEANDTNNQTPMSDDDDDESWTANESCESDNSSEVIKEMPSPKSNKLGSRRRARQQTKNTAEQKHVKRKMQKARLKTLDCDEFIANNFKLSCALCQKPIEDFKELKMHFRNMHEANGYAKCCGKKFYNRGVLVDHLNVHNNPNYFKCQQCDKVACDRSGLLKHLQNVHDTKERRTLYKCEICSKSFYQRKVLARHVLIHAPEEKKIIKCTECDKRFCDQYSMKQHRALVHLNLYAKICDICGKALNGKEALRRHQAEHAGVPIALSKCPLCNAEHKNKYLLTRHMKTMHTEEYQTPQVCPICSKTSPTLRAHKSHMEYMHTAQRKHVCKLCDKAFKLPRCLREHMTTHTGEVLYTCTFCPQTFNSHSNMYAHRKRKHPIEWAEKCAKPNTTTGTPKIIPKESISAIGVMDADGAK